MNWIIRMRGLAAFALEVAISWLVLSGSDAAFEYIDRLLTGA